MKGLEKWLLTILMICCVLIFSNQLLDYYHHSRFLALSAFVLVFSLVIALRKDDAVFNLPLPHLARILLALAVLSTISIFWARNMSEAVFYTQKWIYAFCLYFLLYNQVSSLSFEKLGLLLSQLSRIFSLIIVVVVLYHLTGIVRQHGISNEVMYNLKVLFGHKSLISAFLFLLLPLNFLSGPGKSFRWPNLLLALSQIMIILLIQSRVVYLALASFVVIIFIFLFRNRRVWTEKVSKRYIYLSLVGVLLLTVALLQNQNFRQRLNILTYLKSQTATERQDVWRMTMPLIEDHWLLGVGSGNWKTEFPANGVEGSYRMQDQNVFFTRAHNDFLEIQAELGIFGLLIYIAIFAFALYRLHGLRTRFPWQSHLLLSGIIGFLIFSLIDFPKERLEFITVFILYLVLIEQMHGPGTERKVSSRWPWLIVALLMAGSIYTGVLRYRGERNTALMLEARNAGNWEEVVRIADKAENNLHHLDPYSVPIQFYRGVALYELSKKELAEDAFVRAHSRAPFNFHILNNLATLALEDKEYKQADLWLTEALRINPRFEDGMYNLSFSQAMQGAYSDALQTLDKIPTDSEKKRMFRGEILKMRDKQNQ